MRKRSVSYPSRSMSSLSGSQWKEILGILGGKPTQEDIDALDEELEEFQSRNNMTSTQMIEKLSAGEIAETWDVCMWLMCLGRKERMLKKMNT